MNNTLFNYILPDASKNVDKVLQDLDELFEDNQRIYSDITYSLTPIFGKNSNVAHNDMWIDYCDEVLEKLEIERVSSLEEEKQEKIYDGFIDYIQMRIEEVSDELFGKKIDVTITETLSKTVSVRAKDGETAYHIVKEMYEKEEVVLTADNYLENDIDVNEKSLEKDIKLFYEVDFNTLKKGEPAFILLSSVGSTEPTWIKTDEVLDFSVEGNTFLIKTASNTYTNDVNVFISTQDKYGIGMVKNVKDGIDLYIVRNNITGNQIAVSSREEAQGYVVERLTHTVGYNLSDSLFKNIEVTRLFEVENMYGEESIQNMLDIARNNKEEVEPYITEYANGYDKAVLLNAISNEDFVVETFNCYDSDVCEQFISIMEKFNEDDYKNKLENNKSISKSI